MKVNKWMSLLGLANRARKITSGEELTVKDIRNGKAKLILLSADASANTAKKVTDKCKSYQVPYRIVENREILGHAIGKEARVVVAILDDGFAKKLLTLLD
ncbi:YlxQ family RNA-binding protein [Cytobacillus purgationiresistens]|uniref:Ribosomal protein L7Ae-like RNA K-turn-binding protein n=1 Tax=Cytobacillus purgationiresistens TaxID=863449 RepID=A0ABU0AHJ5_9BACI|nr:YlxQ family RNA-binding protein [Cytobacillus purgationiresistens]MDQ0270186.1 ribosomal protein L7Ae-like RNA K-turn-binding protein [Cytobacillus purgationiresistens]